MALLGEIYLFTGNFAPVGWALCSGQILAIKGNEDLYSLLGTSYGGDGKTSFALPDLRGRVPIHRNTEAGDEETIIKLGQRGGKAPIVLGIKNLPAHTHSVEPKLNSSSIEAEENNPTGGSFATANQNIYSTNNPDLNPEFTFTPGTVAATTKQTGSGSPFDNRQPFLGMNFMIYVTP